MYRKKRISKRRARRIYARNNRVRKLANNIRGGAHL